MTPKWLKRCAVPLVGLSLLYVLIGGVGTPVPNDAVIKGEGNHLVPVKNTTIELKREVLTLKKRGDMYVDVHFEFYNPGEPQKLTVGFVTPPFPERPDGPGKPPIEDFKVVVNGDRKEYDIERLGETDFEDQVGEDKEGDDFVYYFDVHFDAGLNIIKHRYSYTGFTSSYGTREWEYRLTTGKNWAGGTIEEFTLNLDMGMGVFGVTPRFEEERDAVPWEIVGRGDTTMNKWTEFPGGLAFTSRGAYLRMQRSNFSPDENLTVRTATAPDLVGIKTVGPLPILYHEAESCYEARIDSTEDRYPVPLELALMENELVRVIESDDRSTDDLEQYIRDEGHTAEDLRILRNSIFARRGYPFKDPELRAYFNRYMWYMPDSSRSVDSLHLREKERRAVALVRELEKTISEEGE